ncbi:uncharacterized protein SPPG_06389 [Spizellomyces punctatus DAOM BR117]|uniref:Uncharacterized protein n=1 Tax=Spizellomyces punctatus (strain DAOM BR117) TaxID=645134 RepID=A0A0L0HCM3_SPIPD|nr:hypothetical protein, variant [Spizellomyces punctatus DAOM BR117]XP_016606752.1 uncharacterized protein SPPG_06389 [Spizellomyces punctatus DAOM BR117]KNC98711.1 hypothetical protein, variant [Spizellomyces punctatus DAOM BR117]KNC98712.1 hypothetical protein SPPG_06389 [Spizellomyces punctatus DAOM BR117]|eukprot:XP_016606751.1 hypothetical protein, variant [Spizellomyces punctatus DAOM BR117]
MQFRFWKRASRRPQASPFHGEYHEADAKNSLPSDTVTSERKRKKDHIESEKRWFWCKSDRQPANDCSLLGQRRQQGDSAGENERNGHKRRTSAVEITVYDLIQPDDSFQDFDKCLPRLPIPHQASPTAPQAPKYTSDDLIDESYISTASPDPLPLPPRYQWVSLHPQPTVVRVFRRVSTWFIPGNSSARKKLREKRRKQQAVNRHKIERSKTNSHKQTQKVDVGGKVEAKGARRCRSDIITGAGPCPFGTGVITPRSQSEANTSDELLPLDPYLSQRLVDAGFTSRPNTPTPSIKSHYTTPATLKARPTLCRRETVKSRTQSIKSHTTAVTCRTVKSLDSRSWRPASERDLQMDFMSSIEAADNLPPVPAIPAQYQNLTKMSSRNPMLQISKTIASKEPQNRDSPKVESLDIKPQNTGQPKVESDQREPSKNHRPQLKNGPSQHDHLQMTQDVTDADWKRTRPEEPAVLKEPSAKSKVNKRRHCSSCYLWDDGRGEWKLVKKDAAGEVIEEVFVGKAI